MASAVASGDGMPHSCGISFSMTPMDQPNPVTHDGISSDSPPQTLTMWDAVSIIVGIVVGVSIFKAPGGPFGVFANVSSPMMGLGAWLIGAGVALCGALTYAELATMHRRSGGEYIYLTRAYGAWLGFLFGWAQLTGVFSGSIGAMAYVFADYTRQLIGAADGTGVWFACAAVIALTSLHVAGVRTGKTVQNFLTVAKLIGLAMLLVIGLCGNPGESLMTTHEVDGPGFGLAMILILYAYGGWNDSAFVAAEVREPHRNVPRSLIYGMLFVAVIYLLVNLAYVRGLGFVGVRESGTPAADVVANSALFGGATRDWVTRLMGVLVMTSALGALHGMIFTGSRLCAAIGADHRLFAKLGAWNPRTGSPVFALGTQAVLSLALIVSVGTQRGRNFVDSVMTAVGRDALPWDFYDGGFQTLVAATAPVFWMFFLLSGVSLFVFRIRSPDAERPFRVPGYPVVPVIFCLGSAYMVYASLNYAGDLALLALIPLAIGIPVYAVSRRIGSAY